MDFDLDEQQVMLRDLAERFVADRYDLDRRAGYRRTATGFSAENWRLLAELGLLALPFGEASGGYGGGRIELMVLAEALGGGLCAEPWLSDLILAGRLLERAGSDAQRAAWIGRILAGEARVALAHVEHGARYDPLHVTTMAQGDVLRGEKTFVLAGEGCDALIVSARASGGADAPGGLGLWLVAADAAGLDRRAYRLTDGSVACEMRLTDVPGERLPGDAATALAATFDEARIAAAAEMIGIMDGLFRQTLEHLRTRRQFGRPIGAFQVIQHRMADLYVMLEQSRSHVLRAVLAADDAQYPATIAAAKAFVSEQAIRLGEDCIQLHGGMGVTDELAIGHGHKRLLLLANLFGDAEAEISRYMRLVA